ncbi:MAG: sulfatase-like hydrolase/transferase, partial [Anaerolineales bacterium]
PWTLPSHVTLLTGMFPFHHGVNRAGPVPARLPLLAEHFRDAGYLTYATTGGGLLAPQYSFDRGFDSFTTRTLALTIPEAFVELQEGLSLLAWIKAHKDSPYFAFFHTYETHSPYFRRRPYFDRFQADATLAPPWDVISMRPGDLGQELVGGTLGKGLALEDPEVLGPEHEHLIETFYDSEIAYLDAALGRVLDFLEAEGLADETVVVITSDHGESFYEHGLVGHHHLYDDNLHVPLLVAIPGVTHGAQRVAAQVRTADIVPTLLEVAGLESRVPLDGLSLLPLLAGGEAADRPAWAYSPQTGRGIALRTAAMKYIYADAVVPPIQRWEELFDLRRDPGELRAISVNGALRRLREVARGQLARGASGVRLRLANASAESFTLRLSGAGIAENGVVSPDLGPGCCRWQPPVLEVTVPPGRAYSLVVYDIHEGEMTVELASGRAARHRQVLDLSRTTKPFALELRAGAWRRVPAANAPATGLRLWRDARFGGARPRATADE